MKNRKKLTQKQIDKRHKILTIVKWVGVGFGWSVLLAGFISLVIVGVRGCSNNQAPKTTITTPVKRDLGQPSNIIYNYDTNIGSYVDLDYNNAIYTKANNMCGYYSNEQILYNEYYYNMFIAGSLTMPAIHRYTAMGFLNYDVNGLNFDPYNPGNSKTLYWSQLVVSTLTSDNQVVNNSTITLANCFGLRLYNNQVQVYRVGDSVYEFTTDYINGSGVPSGDYFLKITQWRIRFVGNYGYTFKNMSDSSPSVQYNNLIWFEGEAGASMDNWLSQNGFECTNYIYNTGSGSAGSDTPSGEGNSNASNNGLIGVFDLISKAFGSMYNFFAMPIIPGVSMGTLLALPLIATIIVFLVHLFKR